jgi:hypothetical protein
MASDVVHRGELALAGPETMRMILSSELHVEVYHD